MSTALLCRPDGIERVQHALRDQGLDGWLLYEFHGVNLPGSNSLFDPSIEIVDVREIDYQVTASSFMRAKLEINIIGSPDALAINLDIPCIDAYRISLAWLGLWAMDRHTPPETAGRDHAALGLGQSKQIIASDDRTLG